MKVSPPQPGAHIFGRRQGAGTGLNRPSAAEHVELKYVGKLGGNDVLSVRFPDLGPMSDPASSRPGPRNAPPHRISFRPAPNTRINTYLIDVLRATGYAHC